jgi:NTP pyrophosphatase (non-canonical NTP hydrolase)
MTFDEYQKQAHRTAQYPTVGERFVYPTLGLAGEAGEVVETVKKILRDDGSTVSEEKRDELKKELGDVLWYMAQVATEFKLSFTDIAQTNIKKLADRAARGVIHGSGNNR